MENKKFLKMLQEVDEAYIRILRLTTEMKKSIDMLIEEVMKLNKRRVR